MGAKAGLLCLLLVVPATACGGGGGGGPDALIRLADAAPDAPTAPTGSTAKGALGPAHAMATAALGNDIELFEIRGNLIGGASGEVDTGTNQSWWRYTFVSPSQQKAVDVLWYSEMYAESVRDLDPTGLRLITTEWIDSSEAIAKIAENGYQAPPAGDPDWQVAMTLAMYSGPSEGLRGLEEPLWTLDKIHAPPGEDPTGEQWIVTKIVSSGQYLICPPMAQMCSVVP